MSLHALTTVPGDSVQHDPEWDFPKGRPAEHGVGVPGRQAQRSTRHDGGRARGAALAAAIDRKRDGVRGRQAGRRSERRPVDLRRLRAARCGSPAEALGRVLP